MRKSSISGILITAIGIWLGISTIFIVVIALIWMKPNSRAVILMGASLILFWVGLGGFLTHHFRDRVLVLVQKVRFDWRLKFVIFATLLALVEEAITVSLTYMAPLFGVPLGAAYITASANYLDVVFLHSVVVFVPMFIAWALLLSRFHFPPSHVFLLFGVNGVLAEANLSLQAFTEFAMWIFIYGLMVYLPAYCVPIDRTVRKPMRWHYMIALVLPILFSIPVAIIIHLIHPISIHFPPILPNS
jgi:hypothetical protein